VTVVVVVIGVIAVRWIVSGFVFGRLIPLSTVLIGGGVMVGIVVAGIVLIAGVGFVALIVLVVSRGFVVRRRPAVASEPPGRRTRRLDVRLRRGLAPWRRSAAVGPRIAEGIILPDEPREFGEGIVARCAPAHSSCRAFVRAYGAIGVVDHTHTTTRSGTALDQCHVRRPYF
jgi:hypothetical protein